MINNLFFLVFSFFLNLLFSGTLQDHLKRAENKGDAHHMRNIDFIYMINLDKRPEKFLLASEQLEKYGVYPYRFSAVNGWELSVEAIQDIGVKYSPGMTPLLSTRYLSHEGKRIQSYEYMKDYGKTYFCHCMAPGGMGCSLSHISILQDAYDSGYETIWVMEDDIEALEDPNRLSDLIDELDALIGSGNWDVLFTDFDYRIGVGEYLPAYGAQKRPDMDCSQMERYSNKYMDRTQVSDDFRKMSARFGTASMIIRRSGIKKLLDFSLSRNIYLPYDLENYLPSGIKRYGLTFDVVTNMLGSISDLGSSN